MPSVERMRPLLGTFVTIRADGPPGCAPAAVATAIESAFSTISRVERLMSFHRRGSDIGRLNHARAGRTVRVHRWTFRVLREALYFSKASGGVFDCNVGRVLVRGRLLPRPRAMATRRWQPMGKAITMPRSGVVRVNHRVSLDLGGIAKGFAVDQAVRTLRSHGIHSGLVNAGGDLAIFGSEPQPIWARCPTSPGTQRLLGHLSNGAVATSASYFTNNIGSVGSARPDVSAIVHTASARQVTLTGSISVIAKSCMHADALTKICVLRHRIPAALKLRSKAKALKL